MNVVAYRTIRTFYEKHPMTKKALITWFSLLKAQEWRMPQDAIDAFGMKNVDVLRNNRVCINVKGNHLRIILSVNYERNWAYVKWIGWHRDYDKLGEKIHTIDISKY